MNLKLKPKQKKRSESRHAAVEWLRNAVPSTDNCWIYHDGKIKRKSKITILHQLKQQVFAKRKIHAALKIETLDADIARQLKLNYKPGYEPVAVWLVGRNLTDN